MLEDITPTQGSDPQGPPPGGGPLNNSSSSNRNLDGAGPGYQTTGNEQAPNISYADASKQTQQPAEPQDYAPIGSIPANFEDPYESQNAANFNDPEYLNERPAPRRDIMAEARRAASRGKAGLVNRPTAYIGENLVGDKHAFKDDSPENRERVKELAERKIKKEAAEHIGKRIGDEAARKVFQEGLTKGSGAVAKAGAKKATQAAGKAAAEAATQAATKAAAQVGTQAAVKGAQGAITAAGVGTGAASFGLGFLLSLLLNIAISLGLSDAIDSAFELKNGDFKKARFLASRAAAKVGMFVLLLVLLVTIFSVAGLIIALPLLVFVNVYMFIGLFLKNTGAFQGLVWWEMAFVVMLDFMALIILAAFIAGLGWWICDQTGLGTGVLATAATSIYDWWTGSQYTSTINEMCTAINGITR